tara:strand:- start:678 stop:863 length:186 start_codon:yes stop_codon:yes gene_type:complete
LVEYDILLQALFKSFTIYQKEDHKENKMYKQEKERKKKNRKKIVPGKITVIKKEKRNLKNY